MEAFFRLHSGLPREGPGSVASTLAALERLPPFAQGATVVDLGCGPGRQTLVLARELETRILAVDVHEPYLEQLRESARAEGLAERIQTQRVSMTEIALASESLDLAWSEGALYTAGVVDQLRRLRPMLRPIGLTVFTEASWLTEDPSPEARNFWRQYPDMRTVEANIAAYRQVGFEVFDHFTLPSADWWREYYDPLLERVAKLRDEADGDPALASVLAEAEAETEMYRRRHREYGYVFYLCRKL